MQKHDEEQKLTELQNKKIDIKNKIDALIEEIEKYQNIGFESTNQLEKINSEIALANEKIVHNDENRSRLLEEIEESKNKIKDLPLIPQNLKEKIVKDIEEGKI